jgi:hypothetical protein
MFMLPSMSALRVQQFCTGIGTNDAILAYWLFFSWTLVVPAHSEGGGGNQRDEPWYMCVCDLHSTFSHDHVVPQMAAITTTIVAATVALQCRGTRVDNDDDVVDDPDGSSVPLAMLASVTITLHRWSILLSSK